MKYIVLFIVVLSLGVGCKPRVLKGGALKNKLIETMSDYLNAKPSDTTPKFIVKEITFFPNTMGKPFYNCTFTVEMRSKNKDTTGVMAAEITNDFKKVSRTQ